MAEDFYVSIACCSWLHTSQGFITFNEKENSSSVKNYKLNSPSRVNIRRIKGMKLTFFLDFSLMQSFALPALPFPLALLLFF